MSEREQKIAEIRERHTAAMVGNSDVPRDLTERDWTFLEHAWEDAEFLLSELEQKDIAERHLVEISGKLTYQNRMLLDDLKRKEKEYMGLERLNERVVDRFYEGQQEIKQYKNNFHDAVKDLSGSLKREQKLIEGLRWYATLPIYQWSNDSLDIGLHARNVLKEIGVTE